jgi:peptidoglycan/xylan/chitin deacetylase (PgdA/CDA1 family)
MKTIKRKIKKAINIVSRRFKPVAVVLSYHRIAHVSIDPFGLAVSRGHFAQHLEIIRRLCHPISLTELIDALEKHSVQHRSVIVTFDDGYQDNLSEAKPLLELAKVPATVFVTTSSIDSPREFWWDDLERVLLEPGDLPKYLKLRVNGQASEWSITNIADRHIALKAIHKIFQRLPSKSRDKILTELINWAGLEAAGRPAYLPMTASELVQLAQSKFIDVGSHTSTHPLLSTLSKGEQYSEIFDSCKKIETILNKPVNTFAYPYGDFNDEVFQTVKKAGLRTALTVVPKVVKPGDNLFQLGRFGVPNVDGGEFKKLLGSFFFK